MERLMTSHVCIYIYIYIYIYNTIYSLQYGLSNFCVIYYTKSKAVQYSLNTVKFVSVNVFLYFSSSFFFFFFEGGGGGERDGGSKTKDNEQNITMN